MLHKTRYDEAISFVCEHLRYSLGLLSQTLKEQVQEIRLRGAKPLVLVTGQECLFLDRDGNHFKEKNGRELICSFECLEQTFRSVCGYSVHTHQREMVRGYVTVKGGHRVGLGATAVEKEGVVTSIKEISSLCIRVSRQIFGVADSLVTKAHQGGMLLVGSPGCGKTTLLRDLTRQLSGAEHQLGKRVTLLDERGELAAVWDGIPQNDVGMNTDILSGFSKRTAMEMAVRSLSPQVVVCDEIGSAKEAEGLMQCMNAGVQVIASVHAGSLLELKRKPWVMQLLLSGVFKTIVLLDGIQGKGTIERVVDTDEWLAEMDRNTFVSGGFEPFGNAHCKTL
jgi:stage III sporulation protein AA